MNIDFHSHVIPQAFVAAVENDSARLKARVAVSGSDRRIVHDQGYVYPLFAEFTDAAAKIAVSKNV